MPTTFGLLLFDGVEELDFVGPWEVFTASSMLDAALARHPHLRIVELTNRRGLRQFLARLDAR
jgi:putative intracellular protease/amidase